MELIVVGGPNGAGKTRFADEYVARHGCNYVGADAIATQMSPDDPTHTKSSPAVNSCAESTQPQDLAFGTATDVSIRDAELFSQF